MLRAGFPNSFCSLFECEGSSLEDLVQRVLSWGGGDTHGRWKEVVFRARGSGADVRDKPSTLESRK